MPPDLDNIWRPFQKGLIILYHITGRTPDLQYIFGNHLKPGLSRPVGQVCRSNTVLYKCLLSKAEKKTRISGQTQIIWGSWGLCLQVFSQNLLLPDLLHELPYLLPLVLFITSSRPPWSLAMYSTVAYTPPNHQNYEQDQRKYLDLVQSTIIS